jgi:hypothetical protein
VSSQNEPGRHLLDEGGSTRNRRSSVRDVLWTYTAIELYELLVVERGWPLDRYADWIAQAITAALV